MYDSAFWILNLNVTCTHLAYSTLPSCISLILFQHIPCFCIPLYSSTLHPCFSHLCTSTQNCSGKLPPFQYTPSTLPYFQPSEDQVACATHNMGQLCWTRCICYESSLSYPARRPGLVGFRMWQGVWTMASARALCRPSVAVQVFQIEVGICASYEPWGSCRVEGWGGKVSGRAQSRITELWESSSFRRQKTARQKTQVARRQRDNNSRVEVDIRTEETYMTYGTYICETEGRGPNTRVRYRGGNGRARGNMWT